MGYGQVEYPWKHNKIILNKMDIGVWFKGLTVLNKVAFSIQIPLPRDSSSPGFRPS